MAYDREFRSCGAVSLDTSVGSERKVDDCDDGEASND